MRVSGFALPTLLFSLSLLACGSPAVSVDAGDTVTDGGPDAALCDQAAVAVALPQAAAGALFANPTVYASVPLRVATLPRATAVEVMLGDQKVAASDDDGDGTWVASLPIAGMADGTVPVVARATSCAGATTTAGADLVLSGAGVQLTDFAAEGRAASPRIHRRGDEIWLTWTDRAEPQAEAWARRIDGGGRFVGERVNLVNEPDETIFAHVAFGASSIGVLYQKPNMYTYKTRVKIVDDAGNDKLAAIDLDPPGQTGVYGGELIFDGKAYVGTFKTNDGGAGGQVLWFSIDEESGAVTGPIVVAESGDGDPDGVFPPYSYVDVSRVGDVSLVSFVRYRYISTIDFAIPQSQLATVDKDGHVLATQYLGIEGNYLFHREARLSRIGDRVAAIWSAKDLTAPGEGNEPNLFYGAISDPAGGLSIDGMGTLVFDAVGDRDEPFLLAHPEHFGVLTWTDQRAPDSDPNASMIPIYVAPVDEQLQAGAPTVFAHARVFAGIAMPSAVTVGTNVLVTWLDDRHGGGVVSPAPELWFETAWF